MYSEVTHKMLDKTHKVVFLQHQKETEDTIRNRVGIYQGISDSYPPNKLFRNTENTHTFEKDDFVMSSYGRVPLFYIPGEQVYGGSKLKKKRKTTIKYY